MASGLIREVGWPGDRQHGLGRQRPGEEAGGEQSGDRAGAGGEQRPDDGEHEDVEGDEGPDAGVEPGGGRQRGQDQGELATPEDGEADIGGGLSPIARNLGGDDAGGEVEHD